MEPVESRTWPVVSRGVHAAKATPAGRHDRGARTQPASYTRHMRVPRFAVSAHAAQVIVALAVVVVSWMLVVPPGAGADEPSHLVRAGAVVRGEWSGEDVGELSLEAHVLPDSYVLPDTCYAFLPDVPVSCASPVDRTGADVVLTTRADEYQIWPHLVYGLPTLLPGPAAIWWARLAGAAIVVALVGGALLHAGTAWRRVGIVAALTPMALGTFATVNPSTFVIAGAIALWTVTSRRGPWSAGGAWLLAAGWAAMSLSRRDGLVWAVLVVIVLQWSFGWSLLERWRAMPWGPRVAIVLSSAVTVIWGLTNDSRVSQLVALSPLALVGSEVARSAWDRRASAAQRLAYAIGAAGAIAAVTVGALLRRPGGWDSELARTVVGQTGTHLVEAIGVLGWLDAPLPWVVVGGWIVLVGILGAGALAAEVRRPAIALAVLVLAVTTSWVFELLHGNTTGRYWQGRYSLPLLVGIPIVLAAAARQRAVARAVVVTAIVLMNAALWASARRWGVGLQGSLRPWEWDTPHTPVPVVVLLASHAIGSAVLAWVLLTWAEAGRRPDVTPTA